MHLSGCWIGESATKCGSSRSMGLVAYYGQTLNCYLLQMSFLNEYACTF